MKDGEDDGVGDVVDDRVVSLGGVLAAQRGLDELRVAHSVRPREDTTEKHRLEAVHIRLGQRRLRRVVEVTGEVYALAIVGTCTISKQWD